MTTDHNKSMITFGKLPDESIENIIGYAMDSEIFYFIPATAKVASNKDVSGYIIQKIEDFQRTYNNPFNIVLLGLDQANREDYERIKKVFLRIPNSLIIWNDSEEVQGIYNHFGITGAGKGRNQWTGNGFRYANIRNAIFLTMDSDITPDTFGMHMPLSLLYPLLDPRQDVDCVKAYYDRLSKSDAGLKLNGRVTRLLVKPFIKAMKSTFSASNQLTEYLDYLQEFNYPLSGEIAMKPNIANHLRIQGDWGLEIGVINSLYRQKFVLAQAYIGRFDHKHSPVSHNNPDEGLFRMATEVSKTILRRAYQECPDIADNRLFEKMLVKYTKIGRDSINNSRSICIYNNWIYDEIEEHKTLQTFVKSLRIAFDTLLERKHELPSLISWDEVDPVFLDDIIKIAYNHS